MLRAGAKCTTYISKFEKPYWHARTPVESDDQSSRCSYEIVHISHETRDVARVCKLGFSSFFRAAKLQNAMPSFCVADGGPQIDDHDLVSHVLVGSNSGWVTRGGFTAREVYK